MNLPTQNITTMSSVDFLGVINKFRSAEGEREVRNNDFIARIEDECDDLGACENFVSYGKQSKRYHLTQDQMMLVGMRESKAVRKRVLEWVRELENSAPAVPQTLPEALRLAADLAEEKAALEQKVAEDAPKVEFVENFVEFGGSKCISDVAKLIGIPQQRFFGLLRADSIVFKRSDGYRPYAAYEKYFDCKTGERNGHAYIQCRVNNDGIVYLSKRYGDLAEKPKLSLVHSAKEA